jgi:sterol desaturase/sphingolipid hydroxylase (fatty acid hydroxylase superfamily)
MELGTHEGKIAFVAFLSFFVVLEAGLLIWLRKTAYPWAEAAASLGVALIKRVVDLLTAGLAAAFMLWMYDFRIMTLEINSVFMVLALFLSVEFFYYWHHRFGHEIRWLWATHGVHHSANHMNLSVAGRLGVTGAISGSAVFFSPLVLIGFHPVAVFAMLALGLFYQIWIHNEWIGKLGFLEKILNTPSNHRVHHGSNPEYLDKNYGGVLIIFDVMFGTYQEEREDIAIKYGIVKPVTTNNPVKIAFFEWANMARDLANARSFKDAFGFMFRHPGWAPEPVKDSAKRLGSREGAA